MAESETPSSQPVPELVAGLFRRSAGQLTATLTHALGRRNIDLIEEAIQDALFSALKIWPHRGIPDNPTAWLYTAAKNRLIDMLRREPAGTVPLEAMENILPDNFSLALDEKAALHDDVLRCIFACCHPSLTRDSQATLTLRLVCGFNVREIARMLLLNEETVTRRITRAKETFRQTAEADSLFDIASLNDRLHPVLDVIYFLLNAGHTAPEGDELIRPDLAEEARYLALTLNSHPAAAKPELFALLALIYFHLSRLPARLNERGELLTLEAQDRLLWNSADIQTGFDWLNRAAVGERLSEYHLQAAIAAEHAKAKSFAETNWQQIVEFYDMLGEINSSPIVALNRIVAYAMSSSIAEGLAELAKLNEYPKMNQYYLYHAVHADLLRRDVQWKQAIEVYQRAIALVGNDVEKKYLERRMEECRTSL